MPRTEADANPARETGVNAQTLVGAQPAATAGTHGMRSGLAAGPLFVLPGAVAMLVGAALHSGAGR